MNWYLWGFSELVNDPVPQLLQAIQQHVLRNRDTNCQTQANGAETEEIGTTQVNKQKSNHRSVGTQVSTKTVDAYSQKSKSPLNIFHKSTNTVHQNYTDKATAMKIVETVERGTVPINLKICEKHRRVLLDLQNWPEFKHQQENRTKSQSYFKSMWLDFIEIMKMEKIQLTPEYDHHEHDIMFLYRKTNYEE